MLNESFIAEEREILNKTTRHYKMKDAKDKLTQLWNECGYTYNKIYCRLNVNFWFQNIQVLSLTLSIASSIILVSKSLAVSAFL